MAEHPGQWLFEEGMAYYHGFDFKKKDLKRGRLMIEASASSGFPMAMAECHCWGWNGMENEQKIAFEMFVKIEQETNGYHWAQYMLGNCYHRGRGTDQDYTKAVEWYTKSSEQENSVAMNNLGVRYENGLGCDQNLTKAAEWFEKSANLGYSVAMSNLGTYYTNGQGVTKDLNKAREWLGKAAAQGRKNKATLSASGMRSLVESKGGRITDRELILAYTHKLNPKREGHVENGKVFTQLVAALLNKTVTANGGKYFELK